MRRFYSPSRNISGNKIVISDKSEVHHLRDVLRLQPKDEVIVFDEQGNEYNAMIEQVSQEVILNIKERRLSCEAGGGSQINIACAIALPKKSKMDDIVDKLTQLGIERIIPLKTQRVVIKLDKQKEALRLARWRKIAQAAAKQSGRKKLPVIEPMKDFRECLSEYKNRFDLKLIPTLGACEKKTLREVFNGLKPRNILVLIGPEGDFNPQEIDLARNSGCISVSLGELVLRVETAAIAVVSYIKLSFLGTVLNPRQNCPRKRDSSRTN